MVPLQFHRFAPGNTTQASNEQIEQTTVWYSIIKAYGKSLRPNSSIESSAK